MAKKRQAAKKPVDKAKPAEKRARRDERKIADAKAKQAAVRKRKAQNLLIVLGVVAVIGLIGFFIIQKATLEELPGVSQPEYEGRSHGVSGQGINYVTATPTSGRHAGSSPRCGVYAQPLPPDFAVHALEHGAVVIWYQPTLADDVISDLNAIVNRFDDRVILSPNPLLESPVVATAWVRLKTYSGADPELEQFIETYRNRGPENFRCDY